MSRQPDREEAERVQAVARRAVRRLDILEWVIFAVGGVLAALGGAFIAWMCAALAGWDFRSTWIGASLLLFVVAGATAIVQIKRDERTTTTQTEAKRKRDDG